MRRHLRHQPRDRAVQRRVSCSRATSPPPPASTLVKNDKYYDAARVQLGGLSYQVIKDSQTALLSYQNGDLDVVTLSGDQVELVQDDPEFTTMNAGYLWYVTVNQAQYPELGQRQLPQGAVRGL